MEINLGEHSHSLKLVKQIINAKQMILALDCYFVQLPVINEHPHRAILLLHK